MAASTSVAASRKPSDSSTSSNVHSRSGSPGNPQPSRRLTPNQTGAMLGVGMASSRQLKVFGPGWPTSQAWATGAVKRNVSSSTATSVAERSSSHGDSGYRSMSDSGWRPVGGSWEDIGDSAGANDHIQFDASVQSGMRARPAPSMSPSSGFAMPRAPSGIVDSDLARSMQGMTVEADYAQGSLTSGQHTAGAHGSGRSPVQRSPRHYALPPQGPYLPGSFPPTEYPQYQSSVPHREHYGDQSFPYDAYRPATEPTVYAAPPVVANSAPLLSPVGGFYDFSVQHPVHPHPGGFYFTAPMLGPPLAEYPAVSMDFFYKQKQHPQMAGAAMMYPNPLASSPRLARPVEYSPQMPMMVAGGAVYPSLNPAPMFPAAQMAPDRRRMQPAYAYNQQQRSALLDEFRSNKMRRWELRDIVGHAAEFSADQHGSRFMQHRYEAATADVKQKIFDEIVPAHVQQLVQDVFGNYVIQKLFEHGTTPQKMQLVAAMEGSVLAATLQMYGCRVIQKALEVITPEQQSLFVKELDPHIMRCVKDANGNHVVQKLIEAVPVDRLTFVKSFYGSVYELATHPYGCRVLQRCLEKLDMPTTRPLRDELQKYATELMQDQFGNYVVQYLLENGEPQDRTAIVKKLHGQTLPMARHKFASNVVEKALVATDSESRHALIQELMLPQVDGTSPVVVMMKDQFANYVLQRAMSVAEGQQQQELVSLVKPQLAAMRRVSSVYTKHLSSIERCLNKIQKATDA